MPFARKQVLPWPAVAYFAGLAAGSGFVAGHAQVTAAAHAAREA